MESPAQRRVQPLDRVGLVVELRREEEKKGRGGKEKTEKREAGWKED